MNEYLKINEEYIAFCKTLFNFFFYLKDFVPRIRIKYPIHITKLFIFLFLYLKFKYFPQKINTSFSTMKENCTIPLETAQNKKHAVHTISAVIHLFLFSFLFSFSFFYFIFTFYTSSVRRAMYVIVGFLSHSCIILKHVEFCCLSKQHPHQWFVA